MQQHTRSDESRSATTRDELGLYKQLEMEDVSSFYQQDKQDFFTFSSNGRTQDSWESAMDDIFASSDQTCNGLASAKILHSKIREDGLGHNTCLVNYLIQMYGRLGSVQDARAVFDSLLPASRNVKAWNFLIGAYTQNRQHRQDGLRLLATMIGQEGLEPDEYTLINSVSALAQFGQLEEARNLFNRVHNGNVVAWTATMAAYAQYGHCQAAVQLYRDMETSGVQPSNVTLLTILGICSTLRDFEQGRAVHQSIVGRPNVAVYNALVNMYAKCGRLELAREVFDGTVDKNVISWTGMIAAYSQRGYASMALDLYLRMLLEGVEPNAITFVSVLSACSDMGSPRINKMVIRCIETLGIEWRCKTSLQNSLMSLHAKAGNLEAANRIFGAMVDTRDVVSWNTMLGAYVQHGNQARAFQLYHQMDLEGVRPNSITLATILGACTLENFKDGNMIHRRVLSNPLLADDVLDNAILNMYAKCGQLETAKCLFDRQAVKDLVSWNIMIGACVQQGLNSEALEYYNKMDLEPNVLTFATALGACSSEVDAKIIQDRIIASGLHSEAVVQNALLNMHGKCGKIDMARTFFYKMRHRCFVSWNIIIKLHAQHGFPLKALELHREMESEGMKPNGLTLMALLLACNYAGLLEQGQKLFVSLCGGDHGVTPILDHFHLFIDLLARSGRFEEAEELVVNMPLKSDGVGLRALVGSLKFHGEANRGVKAAENALALYPTVCWLEQKPDEVESYLISAASPELTPLEPLAAEVTPKLVEFPTPVKEQDIIARGSEEEEAFLESAVVDAEADSQEAADDGSTVEAIGQEETEEATVLRELQSVVAKLGTNTRLCICNALYRLAGSAVTRREMHETMANVVHSSDKNLCSRLSETSPTGEASTNSLDRTIANLLFHRQTNSVGQENEKNPAGRTTSSKLPAVVTNKQPEFPLTSSSTGTKKLAATNVYSNGLVPRKFPDFNIFQAATKKRLVDNSRKGIKRPRTQIM